MSGTSKQSNTRWRQALGSRASTRWSGRGQLLGPVADVAGEAVDHQLGHRAGAQRDHRGAAGHGLDHDDPERLVPLDGEDQRAGLGQQLLLLLGGGVAVPLGVGAEQGPHALLEVGVLGRLVALGGDHDPPPGRPGRLDGQVRRLLGADAAEEQHEVVLLGLERVLVDRDGVVHRGRPGQVRALGPLRLGDGDHRVVAAEQPVALAQLAGDRPVGGQHRRDAAGPRGQRAAHRVVVDHVDVQLPQVLVGLQGVHDLGERACPGGRRAAPRRSGGTDGRWSGSRRRRSA